MTLLPSYLERAFELAKSGRVARLSDIRAVMRSEGYADMGQISGAVLRSQLFRLIAAARGE